jgi:hypothetical protein
MSFSSVKNLNFRTSRRFSIVLMIFFITGCASEPVTIDLPLNHPANPHAQEAEFTPPPNPFQEDVTAMKGESTPDSMMKHKTHEESGRQHMDHNRGTKKGSEPDSDSTKKSGQGQGDNQHKGHSQ